MMSYSPGGNRVEGNVISANYYEGIYVSSQGGYMAPDNLFLGNYIGVAQDGTTPLPNGVHGVLLYNAYNNIIGTTTPGEGNVIAFNNFDGIVVHHEYGGNQAYSNTIRGNSVHDNGGLGIDLRGSGTGGVTSGVTENDGSDADWGANTLQNFPSISLAASGASTHVVGSLHSTPNGAFTLDFYANTMADPSGFGEGDRFLDSITIATDGSGNADFDVFLHAVTSAGEFITATATDLDGNTSEFSRAVESVQYLPVEIDVKPGSDPNSIDLVSQGRISVAIFTTSDFDAAEVDVSTVVWAGASVAQKSDGSYFSAMEDVDGDGDLDLVVHFRLAETGLLDIYEDLLRDDLADGTLDSYHQSIDLALEGMTNDGVLFRGTDLVDLFLMGQKLRDFRNERDV
jgi:parallel beta-helix repeat protein